MSTCSRGCAFHRKRSNTLWLLFLVLTIWGLAYLSHHPEALHLRNVRSLFSNLLWYRLKGLPIAKYTKERRPQHTQHSTGAKSFLAARRRTPLNVVCGNDGDWVNATWISPDCDTSIAQCNLVPLLQPFAKAHPPRLIFLGDSTIKHLAETIRTFFPNGEVTKRSDICHTIEVLLMMERASFWYPPSSTEGPLKSGLENHFCSDCSGCWGFVYESPFMDIEYIPVEFARDVELQTADTRTTQETVAKYLKASSRETIVFVNTGLHDCAILDCNFAIYEQNLESYLLLLTGIEHITVVWIQTNAVLGKPNFPQQNDRVHHMNQLAARVSSYVGVSSIVNTFDMSKHPWALQNLFVDNVHLLNRRKLYYRTVSNIILKYIICPLFY